MNGQPDSVPPALPPELRAVLPAARWERVSVGCSAAGVYRSTRHVLKVQQRGLPETLFAEKERLRWFAGRIPVPPVLGYATTAEHEFLAMERVRGIDLSHPDAKVHALRNADLLARALRELHALPLRDCPFDMSLRVRLRDAADRVRLGLVDESDFDAGRQDRSARRVLDELLRTRPEREDLVVTHGDACLPNFMVQGEHVVGVIDVGRAGIADRHADVALGARSLRHNYGEQAAELFLDAYGRALIDPAKLDWYRMLDELF